MTHLWQVVTAPPCSVGTCRPTQGSEAKRRRRSLKTANHPRGRLGRRVSRKTEDPQEKGTRNSQGRCPRRGGDVLDATQRSASVLPPSKKSVSRSRAKKSVVHWRPVVIPTQRVAQRDSDCRRPRTLLASA